MLKKERIEVRVTKIEKKILEKKAVKAGLKLSEFIRQCSLETEVKTALSEEDINILKPLYELGEAFRESKKNYSSEELVKIDSMIKTVREILIKLYDR